VDTDSVSAWLAAWQPSSAADRALRDTIVDFLKHHPDGLWRGCREGHVTASAFVVDLSTRRTAFVMHGLARRWLQPGGHLEVGDTDIVAAAAREASEETGLSVVVDPRPLRVDAHSVRCRDESGAVGPSVHFDIGLLALTGPGAVTRKGSDPVAWFALTDELVGDQTMQRLRHAATMRFGDK